MFIFITGYQTAGYFEPIHISKLINKLRDVYWLLNTAFTSDRPNIWKSRPYLSSFFYRASQTSKLDPRNGNNLSIFTDSIFVYIRPPNSPAEYKELLDLAFLFQSGSSLLMSAKRVRQTRTSANRAFGTRPRVPAPP